MRSLLTIIGLLLCLQTFAQLDSLYTQQWNRDPILNLNSTTSAQRQIITAEQIRVSGYTQLSEVLQLIDAWTISSQSEYPFQLQSNGTGFYTQQNWKLMLNGQLIEMDRNPGLDINQLGVAVYDIERIEVVNANGMYLGEFTQNGLIHIVTKKTKVNGISLSGYVASSFNNKHSEANTIATTIGFRHNKFNLNTSYIIVQDPYKPDDTYMLPRLELQYDGTKITHQFQTRSFFQGIDGGAPYVLVGYTGQWKINAHNQIRLSSSLIGDAATSTLNTLQHRYIRARKHGNFIWQNGIGFDNNVYHQYNISILKPFTSINLPITRKANLFSDAQVAFSNNKVGPKLSLGVYKRVSFISNYSFVLGYNESLLEEFFNTSVNHSIYSSNDIVNYGNAKIATADLYYNLNIGNGFKFSFNSGLKNVKDLPDYEYIQQPTPPLSTIGSTMVQQIQPSAYRLNWINRVNIHYDIIKNTVIDINYMHTGVVNTWNESLRTIPKHKFALIIQYELPKRFTLWSRNAIASKTEWYNTPGYFDGSSYDATIYTQPSIYSWELGVSKKLFKEYLKLNFTARSYISQQINHYPSGLNTSFPYSLSILFNINGIGEPKTATP